MDNEKLIAKAQARAREEVNRLGSLIMERDIVAKGFELLYREAYLDGAQSVWEKARESLPKFPIREAVIEFPNGVPTVVKNELGTELTVTLNEATRATESEGTAEKGER